MEANHAGSPYLRNLRRMGDRIVHPLVAVYHVTALCNLNCQYCEDFGARRNPGMPPALPLPDAQRVLRTIRTGTDSLILTGGEPLRYPDILPLVTYARETLGFRRITMLSNGLLLRKFEAVLPYLDRLVISLDALDPVYWADIIQAPITAAETILWNIRTYARRQREFGLRMAVNCVISPETLPGALDLLDFCAENDLLISFSPQAVQNWPRYDLLVSDAYREFLDALIARKKAGAPILGSLAYLKTLRAFQPFDCYPLLVPRIMPTGELIYPCWPIEKSHNGHGGRPCKVQDAADWEQVLQTAQAAYGPPPRMCTSCFQQCYAEPSLMQTHPAALLWEHLRFPASRRGNVLRHAPG